MEVDSDKVPQTRQFITYFDINEHFPWRETRPEQIEQRRALLGDSLIFDLLLSSGGIKQPDALYPPTDVTELQQLLDAIEGSHYDALKKECLVYYLLKWHHDGREERFHIDRCIPPQFAALADAYWSLDTGVNVPRAVSTLSDARINQDYTSKVLQAISLAPNSSSLVVKYVRTARPALTEPDDLHMYTIALAGASSFFDAWEFQRAFNEASSMRPRLFKTLVEWAVTPKPRPAALKQLLFLPLSQFEESLVKSNALESSLPPSSMAVLQDLVCVRLVQAGRYIDAIKTDHEFSASTSSKLKGLTAERTKMIQDLYSNLPVTERLSLDEELKNADKQQPPSSENLAMSAIGGDTSMSSSWEDVRIPHSPSPPRGKLGLLQSLNRDTQPAPKSLAERAQAARLSALLSKKPLTDKQPPLIPTSPSNAPHAASKPVLRECFPLPFNPPSTAATKSAARPRHSAGQVPTGSTLEVPEALPVPSASQKGSLERQPTLVNSVTAPIPTFSSASRSKNAFYEPPTEINGQRGNSPTQDGTAEAKEAIPDEDVDAEMVDADAHHEQPDMDEAAPNLQFSIFGSNATPQQQTGPAHSNGLFGLSPEQGKKRKAVPPGAFLSDEEDAHYEDEHEETARASSATGQRDQPLSEGGSKPKPAAAEKKRSARSRIPTVQEMEQPKRSFPGSLMDEEDEEEDHVAPLRQPSPPRRTLRKGRLSVSSDPGDELETPQTRRRSSRLSTQANATSPDASPKKSSATTGTKKGTKSSTKKKR